MADKVVQAQRFEIVDDDGNVQGVMGQLQDGAVGLQLYDGSGMTRMSVAVLNEKDGAPVVFLRDANGVNRLQIQISPGEISSLVVNDANQNLRAIIGTDSDGNSHVGYSNPDGSERRL